MTAAALLAPLARAALFTGLTPAQKRAIAEMAERIVFADGARIITEGDAGDAAYLIVSGQALRTSGPGLGKGPERLGPGSMIAPMAMLVDTVHGSTVIAEGPVRALAFPRAEMHRLMEEDASIAAHFADRIRDHLAHLAEELRAIYRIFDGLDETTDRGRDAGETARAAQGGHAPEGRVEADQLSSSKPASTSATSASSADRASGPSVSMTMAEPCPAASSNSPMIEVPPTV